MPRQRVNRILLGTISCTAVMLIIMFYNAQKERALKEVHSAKSVSTLNHPDMHLRIMTNEKFVRDTTKADVENSSLNIKLMALEYKVNKDNINFDEKAFLEDAVRSGKQVFSSLDGELRNVDKLVSTLSSSEDFFITKPPVLLERMAMIDFLHGHIEHRPGSESMQYAKDCLTNVIQNPIPSSLPEHIVKVLISEKYDAMQILSQYDPDVAAKIFGQITNERLRAILVGALEEGVSRSVLSQEQLSGLRQILAQSANSK